MHPHHGKERGNTESKPKVMKLAAETTNGGSGGRRKLKYLDIYEVSNAICHMLFLL